MHSPANRVELMAAACCRARDYPPAGLASGTLARTNRRGSPSWPGIVRHSSPDWASGLASTARMLRAPWCWASCVCSWGIARCRPICSTDPSAF